MKERIAEISAEQVNVNPSQQSFLLNNTADLPLPTENYIGNTNKVNADLNDELKDNPRFIESQTNTDSQYINSFVSIKNLLEDKNHAPLIKKYGNDYERREGLWNRREAYNDSNLFGQLRSNWNNAMQGVQMGEKQHSLDLARESGDAQKIEEALADVQKQQEIIDKTFQNETRLGRGTLSVTASIADNPWAVAVGAAASILTAGLGAPAWVIGLAGGVAGAAAQAPRSYELMAGEAYQIILEENPDISQAEAHKLAREAGIINTLIETIPSLLSLGAFGGGVAKIGRPLARALKAAKLRPGLIDNPAFKEAFGFSAKKVWLGTAGRVLKEDVADASVESLQEVFQDIITDAASSVASGKSTSIESAADLDLAQFLANPLAPENADKIETIVSTFLGSMVFTGGSEVMGDALKSGSKRIAQKTKSMADAAREHDESRSWFQNLFNWRQNSRAGKEKSPSNRVHLEQMIKNLQTPGDRVYIDESKAKELMESLDSEKIRLLKLDEAIANKDKNGGLISIALADYDEVVSTDGELFQQIKDNISIDPTVFSTKALVDRILASEKGGAELSVAKADKNSVFNNVLKTLSRNKNMSPVEREYSASLAQLVFNRASDITGNEQSSNDLFSKMIISMGRSNPTTVMESKEQAAQRQADEKELKRRIRITDSDTLGQILSERGFSIRGLTGREIRAAANANLKLFTLDDKLSEMSQGQRIQTKISDIEKNKAQGDQLLLDAGMTQEQINSLKDDEWNRLVIGEFKRKNKELGIADQDTLLDDDSLEMLNDWDELFQTINIQENVKSKEFKKWFGDSKVVDADGTKENQLKIINETNPAPNDTNTWIRSVDDIKTFSEAIQDDESFAYPDFTREDAEKALQTGYITVYSSNDIKNGNFVTPSKMQAQDYAGNKSVKQETLPITDIAWINADEGQVAKNSVNNQGTFSKETGNIYYQTNNNNNIAGSFKKEFDKYIIRLESMSNPTTFSHEMFHFFNTFLIEQYNTGKLSEYWKTHAESLSEFAGGKIENGVMSFDTKAMELGADAFTNYIRQGKVQNPELRPIMALMKHLFQRVYRALGIRKVKLNKKITEVFDSIFMAQTEIEQLQRNQGLLAVEKPVGADNELYDDYQKNTLTSRARASEKYVRDLESYNKERQSKQYKKDVENKKFQIIGRLESEPFYKAKLKYDELIAKGIDSENAMLSIQSEFADELTLDDIQRVVSYDINQDAQSQAEMEIDEKIKEKYDLLDETLAEKAFKNTDKAKALLQEYVLLTGGTMKDFQAMWVDINEQVERDISTMEIGRIFDRDFWIDAEAMAIERYLIYKQTGRNDLAADQRRTQAIITLVRMKSESLRNRFNKFQRHAKSMSGQQATNVMDAHTYDLLQTILKAYRFPIVSRRITNTPLMTKLNNWLQNTENMYLVDFSSLKPFFPEIAQGLDKPNSKMTVNQFEKLETLFNPIDKFGREIWQAQKELDEQTKQTRIQQVIEYLKKTNARTDSKLLWGSFANPEPMIRKLNPQEVVDSYFTPLMNALSITETERKDMYKKADDALRAINHSEKKTIFGGVEIAYADMADLLVAMGNKHAFDNFVKKFNITREQAEVMASDALNKNPKYAKYMNAIWGIYEQVLPALNESYVKTTNRVFIEKGARKFSVNGIEFAGGYVPENKHTDVIVYDQNFISNTMGESKNEKLIIKEADGNVKSVVRNIHSHIFMFSKLAYTRVAYNRAAAFFGSKEYRDAVGEIPAQFIENWLKAQKEPLKTDSKAMSLISGMANVAVLGWNLGRIGVQLTGIIAASSIVNPYYFGRSIPKMFASMASGRLISDLKQKSAYMNARYENPAESILGMKSSSLNRLKSFQQIALMPLTWGDAMASYIVWDGKYNQSINEGRTDQQSRDDADAAVRMTQSDSMTASRAQFLQSEWSRMLTPFMSYIMSMQSLVRGSLMSRDYGEAARVAVCYIIFAPFFESIFKELMPDPDDEDKEFWERVAKRYVSDATSTLGTSIVPIANLGGSVLTGLAAGIDKGTDGELDIYKSYQMSVPVVAYMDSFRQIANATALYATGYEQDKAFEKMITGTGGIVFGTEGKKWIKRFLAGD